MNLLKYSIILIVILLCLWCIYQHYARDTFINSGPYYDVNTPVYIRRNSIFCYYEAIITVLPTPEKPYYTVSYQEGDENPNGSKTYEEDIPENDVFLESDDIDVRSSKRMIRREKTDIQNIKFVDTLRIITPNAIFQYSSLAFNVLFCYPRKLNDILNSEYPVSVSAANAQQAHQALISQIMGSIDKMTFLNVHSVYINNAPSPILDQHADFNYENTYNGLSYTNISGCPDQLIATHPNACAMRYKPPFPLPLQMSLVGSDLNGSILQMFSKKMLQLQTLIDTVYGQNEAMLQYNQHFQECLQIYEKCRKRIPITKLKTIFSSLLDATVFTHQNMNTLMVTAIIALRNETHGEMHTVTQSGQNTYNYDAMNNRLFLLPLTLIPNYTSRAQTTVAQYFCEHDSVISVGPRNYDVTAEISYAAKQSTTVCRLSFVPDTGIYDMMSQTLASKSVIEKDRYFLSVWLFLFCVSTMDFVLQNVSQLSSVPKGTIERPNTTYGLAGNAKLIMCRTLIELFSIITTIPVDVLAQDPLIQNWKRGKKEQVSYIQPITNKYLFQKFPQTQHVVNKVEWQDMRSMPTSQRQGYNTSPVNVSWNNLVYGTSVTPNYGARNMFDISTSVYAGNTQTTTFHIKHKKTTGWSGALHLFLNKRIISHSVLADQYMKRIMKGTQTFGKTPYAHLNSDVVYGLFPENVSTSHNQKYYNGLKYKSQNDKCYRLSCPDIPSKICCSGKSDVKMCSTSYLGNPISCTEPPQIGFTESFGKCRSDDFDRSNCEHAFTEMIENCRNGILIIEPENEILGIQPFLKYITDTTYSGVRLQLLNKMVKTLVLKMYEFGSSVFSVVPTSAKDPSLNTLALISRALQSLFHYYIVIGTYSPYVVNHYGTKQNPLPFVSVAKDTIDNKPTIMYQSYKCVTLTLRRIYENSLPFLEMNNSLISVAQLKTYVKNKNYTHIKQWMTSNQKDVYMDVIGHLCHPYMAETLRYSQYHDTGTTYAPALELYKKETVSKTDKKTSFMDEIKKRVQQAKDKAQQAKDKAQQAKADGQCKYEIKIIRLDDAK